MRFSSLYFLLLLFFFSNAAFGQIEGRVMDAKSNVGLAFVSIVVEGQQNGTYSDIDGKFELSVAALQGAEKLRFTFVGYEAKWVPLSEVEDGYLRVKLEPKPVELGEAIILPGVNPAERIVRNAIDAKSKSDPERNSSFTYDAYNKLILTALLDSTYIGHPEKVAALDSSDQEMIQFFEEQHLLMMESISERRFLSRGKETEIVKASKVSGLSTPDFALLSSQLQSFSFYKDEVALLDIRYLSPLHDQAIRKYLFVIEDTTYQDADTVFVLSYRPRKGKNFDGLQGLMYINTNGYALQSVIAKPAEENPDLGVNIRQRYELINNEQWFPVQLNTDLVFNNAEIDLMTVVGIGRSYISNIQLNPELRGRDIGEVALRMDEITTQRPEAFWNTYRNDTLDHRELKTYTFMDSVSKEMKLDQKYKWLQALSTGRIGIGWVDFDLTRLADFNSYEGFRLGGGLYTNDKLIRNVSVGGYVGYGFRDRGWKMGAESIFTLRKRSDTRLTLFYQNDVFERGGQRFPGQRNGFSDRTYYELYVKQMDRIESIGARFHSRLPGYLTLDASYFVGNLQLTQDYRWVQTQSEGVDVLREIIPLEEASIRLGWSFREKMLQTVNRRVTISRKWPLIGVMVDVGRTDREADPQTYTRLAVSLDHTFKTALLGDFSIFAHAGQVDGNAPLTRMFHVRGSAERFGVNTPMAFETVLPNTMYHERYAALHLRHNFKDLFFSTDKWKPGLALVHSMMWGEGPSQPSDHRGVPFTDASAGYFESGIELNNLLTSGFTGFGIGGYYRHGAANTGVLEEDLMFKVTLGFTF